MKIECTVEELKLMIKKEPINGGSSSATILNDKSIRYYQKGAA